jgi:hypothetical protein
MWDASDSFCQNVGRGQHHRNNPTNLNEMGATRLRGESAAGLFRGHKHRAASSGGRTGIN